MEIAGLKFSMRTSASEIRVFRSVRPECSRKFAVTYLLFRPKLYHQKEVPCSSSKRHLRIGSPVFGGSTLMTSAPKYARRVPAKGPANSWPTSITFMPVRGNLLTLVLTSSSCRRFFGHRERAPSQSEVP